MKLVTFSADGFDHAVGAVVGEREAIIDLGHLAPDMRSLFELGEAGLDRARDELAAGDRPSVTFADAKLHAPIGPRKFFHTAGNFREHEDESKRVSFSHPIAPWIVFFQNVDAIIGHDEPVVYPEHLTRELDYELELCVVMGRAGKHFGPDEAMDHVAGYVIFNDITARDIQRREMKSGVFSFCKAIDTFCPLGPWIVTKDEVPDPHDLDMRLTVNGEERQASNTGRMDYSIAEIVASYSPLSYSAGDVLSTGTVAGIAGFSEDPQAWYLRPGDVMEAYVERIGTLRNPVISWAEAHGAWAPAGAPTGAV